VAQTIELHKPEALFLNSSDTKNKTKFPDKRKIESRHGGTCLNPSTRRYKQRSWRPTWATK
jgi:hypothetical protein